MYQYSLQKLLKVFFPIVLPKDINAFPPPDPELVDLKEGTTKGKFKITIPLRAYILIEN